MLFATMLFISKTLIKFNTQNLALQKIIVNKKNWFFNKNNFDIIKLVNETKRVEI